MKKYLDLVAVLKKHNCTISLTSTENLLITITGTPVVIAEVNMVNELFAGISWSGKETTAFRNELEQVMDTFPSISFMGLKSRPMFILGMVCSTALVITGILLAFGGF